ncbi:MAG TPA: M48 family metalloprotease [Luteitalea sp.]|nr:M48 family metalloprotease [Luteitalea sp.]
MNEDKGTRYRRAERRLRLLETLAAAAGLLLVAASPVARTIAHVATLASRALHVPAGLPTQIVAAAGVLAVTVLAGLALSLPFAIRRVGALARHYGARVTPAARVCRRAMRRGALLVGSATAAWAVFALVHATIPWLAGVATVLTVLTAAAVVMLLAPWVVGWSSHVRAMRDEALTGRLHALAARSQIRLIGLQEWVFGDTDEANAAIVGVVGPRRLLVSDTLIAGSTPEEIDVVVAHELGHHVHGHTWRRARAQAASFLVAGVAAHLCAAAMAWCTSSAAGAADPILLPWMLVGVAAVWLAGRPSRLALSRAHEAEADAFAVALTGRPDVLERVLVRLGARNLASDDDSTWTRAFFLTHPPVAARVAAARQTPNGETIPLRRRAVRVAPSPDLARPGLR